jgi:malate dehydrogenase
VISKKGATVDAPGNAIARMVKAVAWDRREVLPASTFLDGQYGVEGVGIGVPLMLGAKGVEKVYELQLDEKERAQFMKGVETIKEGVAALPPL